MESRLALTIFAAFFAILESPTILMASDCSRPQELDQGKVIETRIESKELASLSTKITSVNSESKADVISFASSPTASTMVLASTSITSSQPTISIAGHVIPIVDVATTTAEPGSHVNRYNKKFLYGHNSVSVFARLSTLLPGSTFSISENDAIKNYSVQKIVTYEKNGEKLQLNGSGNYMRSVSLARSDGVYYDLALMTCAGVSYGNGDASHRLVIFANEI